MIQMQAQVTINTDKYIRNLGLLSVIVGTAAAQVATEAKRSLEPHGQYRFYPEYGHWSSPPGTPPNSNLGFLAESIKPKMIGTTEAEVRVHQEYGLPLEMGTSTIAARPFMKPALDKIKPVFIMAVKGVL
jgi:hypothetical protein